MLSNAQLLTKAITACTAHINTAITFRKLPDTNEFAALKSSAEARITQAMANLVRLRAGDVDLAEELLNTMFDPAIHQVKHRLAA